MTGIDCDRDNLVSIISLLNWWQETRIRSMSETTPITAHNRRVDTPDSRIQ